MMKKFSILTAAVFLVILSGLSFGYSQSSADYKKACSLIKRGGFQQAVNILAPLAADNTFILNDHAQFKLAVAFDEAGNNDQAKIEFKTLIAKYPDSVLTGKAYYKLGELCARKADFLGAVSNFEKSIASNMPMISKDAVLYRAAQCLEKLGYGDEAAKKYAEIVVNHPKSKTVKASRKKIDQLGALSILYSAQSIYENTKSFFGGGQDPDDVAEAVWKEGFSLYRGGDFEAAFYSLGRCPENADPRLVAKCVFWRAKSALKAGMTYEAQKLLEYIAGYYPYTYYGMRACQALELKVQSIPGTGIELPKLNGFVSGNIHFEKYRELFSIKYFDDAISEANAMISSGQDEHAVRTGKLCVSIALNAKKDYYRSIKAIETEGEYDFYSKDIDSEKYLAMNLAYPEAFKDHVFAHSKKYGVDPYLMFALIREESRFDPKAVSRTSARGLSQIMPRTGRGIAKNLYLRPYRTSNLFNPGLNIKMGVYYLSLLLKRFDGDKYLALASYNGGAGNVDKWLNRLEYSDIDEFVESIPFKETKLYVKKVLESYWQYKRLYEGG